MSYGNPYHGLDSDGNWSSGDFAERLDDDLLSECPDGCGMSSLRCVCKPQPYKTLTQLVREAEADVDLQESGLTMEDWQRIRQWPEDGTHE